jgi:hypothetical protein
MQAGGQRALDRVTKLLKSSLWMRKIPIKPFVLGLSFYLSFEVLVVWVFDAE